MAKMLYYKKTFNLYENDVKKSWALIKETLQQKKNMGFLQSLSGMIGISLILTRLLINLIHIS